MQPVQPSRPVNSRPSSFSPAFPPPELYTGPKYDQFGNSFTGAEDYIISGIYISPLVSLNEENSKDAKMISWL